MEALGMRRNFGWKALLGLIVVSTALTFGVVSAQATVHGVAQGKSCASPVKIGDPYTCFGLIRNTVDGGQDTIRVFGLNDTVNSAGGAVPSGNILGAAGLIFGGTGPVTC